MQINKADAAEIFQETASTFQSGLQIFSLGLIGFMMTVPVGLPLVLGGVWEGFIPLTIGSIALFNLWKQLKGRSRRKPSFRR